MSFFNKKNYIDRLKAGREEALYEVYDIYIPLVKGITKNVLGTFNDEGMIDECVNDAFLAVWNNIKKFKGGEAEFKKWIATIAKFKSIDYYRKKIKESKVILENLDGYDNDIIDNDIASEKIRELMELINSLDDIDRKVFILKFFLGEKSEEIARRFNLTKSSVDSRIYRSKKKIRCEARINSLEVM